MSQAPDLSKWGHLDNDFYSKRSGTQDLEENVMDYVVLIFLLTPEFSL